MRARLLLVTLLIAGCSKSTQPDSKAAFNKMVERNARVAEAGDNKPAVGKVETRSREADGSATNSSAVAVKVPEDFPEDIPVYSGATPIIHQAVKNGRTLQLKTSDPADKVTAFYKEKLKTEGWKQVSESSSQSPKQGITLLSNTKDNRTLSVVISHDDEGTSITLSVSTKE